MPSKATRRHIDLDGNPLVSVITPVYNAERYLSACVESVLSQTYTHWELLLINDASTDASARLARDYADADQRISLFNLPSNHGAAYSRNLGTQKARGDFIAFLDADDLWYPQKLDVQLHLMAREQCPVCFSSYRKIDQQGEELGILVQALPRLSYAKQLLNNYVGNLTGIYHAASLGKIMAPDIRKRQDWAIWLEAIRRSGVPATGIQEPLAAYRLHSGSMSSRKIGLLKYNYAFYRKHLGYSVVISLWRMLCFLKEYFFCRPRLIKRYAPGAT